MSNNFSLTFNTTDIFWNNLDLLKRSLIGDNEENSPKMHLSDADLDVNDRLQETGFQLSPTQPDTAGDGDCFVHVLLDQMEYDRLLKHYKVMSKLTAGSLRLKIVASLDMFLKKRKIEWLPHFSENPALDTKEKWSQKMSNSQDEYSESLFIQLASDLLNRKFVIIPVFPPRRGNGMVTIEPLTRLNSYRRKFTTMWRYNFHNVIIMS